MYCMVLDRRGRKKPAYSASCVSLISSVAREKQMNKSYKTAARPEKLSKKTFHRAKYFVHGAFRNVKSFLSGGYQKLHKASFTNAIISRSSSIRGVLELDRFCNGFSESLDSDQDDSRENSGMDEALPKAEMKGDGHFSGNMISTPTSKIAVQVQQNGIKSMNSNRRKEIITKNAECREEKARAKSFRGGNGGGSEALAQRMKDLNMMDMNDLDHVLDIEEVLHYYSRLTSPVYLEIVDKFFIDMYKDFRPPHRQPSLSVSSSMRSLGPVRI